MYWRTEARKSQKNMVRESQISQVSHLRKVRKCFKLFNSESLRSYDLRNLFAHRSPLLFRKTRWSFQKR
jgi:hypothetical protein